MPAFHCCVLAAGLIYVPPAHANACLSKQMLWSIANARGAVLAMSSGGAAVSANGGASWQSLQPGLRAPPVLAGSWQFLNRPDGLYASNDFGRTGQRVGEARAHMGAGREGALYACSADQQRVERWDGAKKQWQATSAALAPDAGVPHCLAVSASGTHILVQGTHAIHSSGNGGKDWVRAEAPNHMMLLRRPETPPVIDARGDLYKSVKPGSGPWRVQRSVDQGTTWKTVAAGPALANQLVASSDRRGVYVINYAADGADNAARPFSLLRLENGRLRKLARLQTDGRLDIGKLGERLWVGDDGAMTITLSDVMLLSFDGGQHWRTAWGRDLGFGEWTHCPGPAPAATRDPTP